MGFHSRLNSKDLHAPSRLNIRNDGTREIQRGDIVFIIGYIAAEGVYSAAPVNPDYHSGTIQTTEIFGVSDTNVPINIASEGTVVTFGVAENLTVQNINTNSRGSTVFLGLANDSSLGTLTTSGGTAGVVPVGTVLGSTTTTADVLMFSLESGFTRSLFTTNKFRGFYDPRLATTPEKTIANVGTAVLTTGDYFVANFDQETAQAPFNIPGITRGSIFTVESIPPGSNGRANSNLWASTNYSVNLAQGGGASTTGIATGTATIVSKELPVVSEGANIRLTIVNSTGRGTITTSVGITAGNPTLLGLMNDFASGLNTVSSTNFFPSQYTASTSTNATGQTQLVITANSAGAPFNSVQSLAFEVTGIDTTPSNIALVFPPNVDLTGGIGSTVDLSVNGTPLTGNPNLTFSAPLTADVSDTQTPVISARTASSAQSGVITSTTFDRIESVPEVPTFAGSGPNEGPGDYVLEVTSTTRDWVKTSERFADQRLEVTVINGTGGATLAPERAYQINSDNYDPVAGTVTITATNIVNGSNGERPTGLVWLLEQANAGNNQRARGVIQGLINVSVTSPPAVAFPVELTIDTNGSLITAAPNIGDFVIGALLPAAGGESTREFIFDGLSTYQVPVAITSATTIGTPPEADEPSVLVNNITLGGGAQFRKIKTANDRLAISIDGDNSIVLDAAEQITASEGLLVVNINNTTTSVLVPGRAYTITPTNFDEANNIITISSSTLTIAPGSTGMVWIKDSVPASSTVDGAGVLKGVVNSVHALAGNMAYENATIDSSGEFTPVTSATGIDAYIVGSYQPGTGGPRDVFFDGLSNTTVGAVGTITFGGQADTSTVNVTQGTSGLAVSSDGTNTARLVLNPVTASGVTDETDGAMIRTDKDKLNSIPTASSGADGQILEVSSGSYTLANLIKNSVRLRIINQGSTLGGERAYSLNDVTIDNAAGTLTLPVGATEASLSPAAGETGLFFLETAISPTVSGEALLKGVIDNTVTGSTPQIDLSITAAGVFDNTPTAGQYIVGTTLEATSVIVAGFIVFDGLSNYKLVTGGGTAPADILKTGVISNSGNTLTITRDVNNSAAADLVFSPSPAAFVKSTTINTARDKVLFADQGDNETFFTNPLNVPPAPATNNSASANYLLQREANQVSQTGIVLGFPSTAIPQISTGNGAVDNFDFNEAVPVDEIGDIIIIGRIIATAQADAIQYRYVDTGAILATGESPLVGRPVIRGNNLASSVQGGQSTSNWIDDFVLLYNTYFRRTGINTTAYRLPGAVNGTTSLFEERVGFFSNTAATNLTPPGTITRNGVFGNMTVGTISRLNDAAKWVIAPTGGTATIKVDGANVTDPDFRDSSQFQVTAASNGQITYASTDVTANTTAVASLTGTSGTISSITDVDTTGVTNGEVLTYNTGVTPNRWEAGSPVHTIQNPNGGNVADRANLQFSGDVAVTDDGATPNRTDVTIAQHKIEPDPAGGGISPVVTTTRTPDANGNISTVETTFKTLSAGTRIGLDNTTNTANIEVSTTAEINNLLDWDPALTYALRDQRVYAISATDHKLFECIQAVTAARSTTPDMDTLFWQPVGVGSGSVDDGANLGTNSDGEVIFAGKVATDLTFKRIKQGLGVSLTAEANDVLIETNGRFEFEVSNQSTMIDIPAGAVVQFDQTNFVDGKLNLVANPPNVEDGQTACLLLEDGLGRKADNAFRSVVFEGEGANPMIDDNVNSTVTVTVSNGRAGSPFSHPVPVETTTGTVAEKIVQLAQSFVRNWTASDNPLRDQYVVTTSSPTSAVFNFTTAIKDASLSGTVNIIKSNELDITITPSTFILTQRPDSVGRGLLYGIWDIAQPGKFTASAPYSVRRDPASSVFYGQVRIPPLVGDVILGERLKNVQRSEDPDPVRQLYTFNGLSTAKVQAPARLANLPDVQIQAPLKTGQKLVYTGSVGQLRIPFNTSVMMDEFDQVKVTFPPNLRHLSLGGIHGPIYGYEIRAQRLGAAFESNDRHLRLFIADDTAGGARLTITQWLNNSLEMSTSGNDFDPQGLRDYNVSNTGSTDPQDNLRPNNSFGTWDVEATSTSIDLVFTFNTTVTQADINAITVEFTSEQTEGNRIPKSGLQTIGRIAGTTAWVNEGAYGQNIIRARYLSGPTIAPFSFVGIAGSPDATGAYTIGAISNFPQDAEVYVTGDEAITAGNDVHTLTASGLINEFQIPSSTGPFSGAFLDTNKRLVAQGASTTGIPNEAVGKIVYAQNGGVDPQLWVFEKFNANRLGGKLTNNNINAFKGQSDALPGANLGTRLSTVRQQQLVTNRVGETLGGGLVIGQPFNPTFIKTDVGFTLPGGNSNVGDDLLIPWDVRPTDVNDPNFWEVSTDGISRIIRPVPYIANGDSAIGAVEYTVIAGAKFEVEMALEFTWSEFADGLLDVVIDFADGFGFTTLASAINLSNPGVGNTNNIALSGEQSLIFRARDTGTNFWGQQAVRLLFRRHGRTGGLPYNGTIAVVEQSLQNAIPNPFGGLPSGVYKGAVTLERTF